MVLHISNNLQKDLRTPWDCFSIVGADGLTYNGVRPSQIKKPFKDVTVFLPDGQVRKPIFPKEHNSSFVGFDAFLVCALADTSTEVVKFRIVSLYNQGSEVRRYSNVFGPNGYVQCSWMN